MTVRRHIALLAAGAAVLLPVLAGSAAAAAAPAPAPIPVDLRAGLVADAEVTPGEVAGYTLTTIVPGPPSPTNVRMILTLPDGLTFSGGGGSGPCTADSAGKVVTCFVDTGGTDGHPGGREWGVGARADESLPIGTILTARAEVLSDGDETNPADNTVTRTSRVVGPGPVTIKAIAPAEPVVPGSPIRLTVRIHYGAEEPIDGFLLMGSMDGPWYYGYGRIANVPADCWADPGAMNCEVKQRLEPGQDLDLQYVIPTADNDEYGGTRTTISFRTYSFSEDALRTSTVVTFADRPPGTPSPTPTQSATGGADGQAGSDGQAGGGLPVTGAATATLTATGALLIAAGAGIVLITRRRRRSDLH